MAGDRAPEPGLVDAVRQRDEDAFGVLVQPYRAAIHAHCYRMLSSLFDADDALQETLLRAWRALPRFQGHELLRPWLYRIATNVCLDALARRRKRGLPIEHGRPAGPHDQPGEQLAEPVWVEPYPDQAIGLQDGYASPEARYSSGRRSNSRSSRLCSTSAPRSAPCSCSATCSASRPKRPPGRWVPRSPRS